MIYFTVILAFFFTACAPTPFKIKLFEYEITHPSMQEAENEGQQEK